jgi:hypothetical protein
LARNVRPLSETPHAKRFGAVKLGVFDRAVSREPLVLAADVAGMWIEWCFALGLLNKLKGLLSDVA